MELVKASELARHTGLAPSRISYLVKTGVLPTQEDSNGRKRFDLQACQAVMDERGIRPRSKSIPAASEEAQDDTGSTSDDQVDPRVAQVLGEALRRSQARFRSTLFEQIKQAREDDEDPLQPEQELALLRMYAHAGDAFDALREALTT